MGGAIGTLGSLLGGIRPMIQKTKINMKFCFDGEGQASCYIVLSWPPILFVPDRLRGQDTG